MSESRSGRPRVAGPYDTSAHVREVLANLHKDGEQTEDDFGIQNRESGKQSGFLGRLVADYFRTGSIPVRLKDVVESDFKPGIEDTKMWGDTFTGEFTPGVTAIGPPTPVLNAKINRKRPTSFNLLANVVLIGAVWGSETNLSRMIFIYNVGVGQSRATVIRFLDFTPSTMDSVNNLRVISDVFTTPLQSFVVTVVPFLPVVNANILISHQFQVSLLASPQVT
jgi:hypothetical protein